MTTRPVLQPVCTACGTPQPLQKLVEFRRQPGSRLRQLLCTGCLELALDDDNKVRGMPHERPIVDGVSLGL
jgi:hypothetical protein